ncbi:MAG: AAA family ATPase, partial [Deltaproteobacteria bacterium]
MYSQYFGFTEKPFTLAPNPRFLYLSKSHKEAFAQLLYGINKHLGLIVLTGEVGTGKTTIIRALLLQLQKKNFLTALILKPNISSVELLRGINREYGINASGASFNELLPELTRFLVDENTNGRTVVLVIEQAQQLTTELLELIRLISNLETKNDKLVQIILTGQPELESLLAKPEHCHLNQRIAVRYRVKPIAMEETADYIYHRMKIAGETGSVSFSSNAFKIIHAYSQGVPSMINILCDRALLVAYGNKSNTISVGIIRQAY